MSLQDGESAGSRRYSAEVRRRAVQAYLQADPKRSVRSVAQDCGVSHTSLRGWIRAEQDRAGRPAAAVDAESEARIGEVALQLMRSRGASEVTVDAVAELTGIERGVLAARFGTSGELIMAAWASVEVPPPDLGAGLHEALEWFVDQVQRLGEFDISGDDDQVWMLGLEDPEFLAARRRLVESWSRQVEAISVRAHGVIVGLDLQAVLDAIINVGPDSPVMSAAPYFPRWRDTVWETVTSMIPPAADLAHAAAHNKTIVWKQRGPVNDNTD